MSMIVMNVDKLGAHDRDQEFIDFKLEYNVENNQFLKCIFSLIL